MESVIENGWASKRQNGFGPHPVKPPRASLVIT